MVRQPRWREAVEATLFIAAVALLFAWLPW
jgi:hypothetical protein